MENSDAPVATTPLSTKSSRTSNGSPPTTASSSISTNSYSIKYPSTTEQQQQQKLLQQQQLNLLKNSELNDLFWQPALINRANNINTNNNAHLFYDVNANGNQKIDSKDKKKM